MRSVLLTLVTLFLAWGVWELVGVEESLPSTAVAPEEGLGGPDPRVTAGDAQMYAPGTMPTSGTLVVRVLSLSQQIPEGARVGYVYGGRERLRRVNERGQVTFTDTPLGPLEVVARAPGYERGTQKQYLNAGLPTEVLLVLKREEGFKAPQDPPKDR